MSNGEKVVETLFVRTAEQNPALATGHRYIETSTSYKAKGMPERSLKCGDMFSEDLFSVNGLIKKYGAEKGNAYADTMIQKAVTIDIQRVCRTGLKKVAGGNCTAEEFFGNLPTEYYPGMKLEPSVADPEAIVEYMANADMATRIAMLRQMKIPGTDAQLANIAKQYGPVPEADAKSIS